MEEEALWYEVLTLFSEAEREGDDSPLEFTKEAEQRLFELEEQLHALRDGTLNKLYDFVVQHKDEFMFDTDLTNRC